MHPTLIRLKSLNAPMKFKKGADSISIQNYESKANIKLPSEYIDFLKFSNGGEIFVPGTRFFNINENDEFSLSNQNTKENRSIFSLNESLIVIGSLNFGDLICINLQTSEVIQWDHETDQEFLRWRNFFDFLDDEIDSYYKGDE